MSSNWPSRIVLVRHGESVRNVIRRAEALGELTTEQRAYWKNVPEHLVALTEKGERQAASAGKKVAEKFPEGFDAAFHSGYVRTKETLRGVLSGYSDEIRAKTPVIEDVVLREREPGISFTMTLAEELETFPWWDEHFKKNGRMFSRSEAGESAADALLRMNLFLMKLRLDWADATVIVSMHGRTLCMMRMILEGWSIEQAEHFMRDRNPERPKNAGITVYKHWPAARKMVLVNYNEHCGHPPPEPR